MVISKQTIERIKRILKKNYAKLAMGVLGAQNLSDEEKFYLQREGVDLENHESLMEALYNYNYINDVQETDKPDGLEEALAQQSHPSAKPKGEAHSSAYEHLNSNMQHIIEKHRNTMISRIEGYIRDNNNDYKYDALQNLTRPDNMDEMVKEATVGDLKRQLRDMSGDANRNWTRIAVTETSNAIGMGSVDRLVKDNKEKAMDDVYVYRINPDDSATCKYCKSFYIDKDGSPKVYKMSTILNNGSNYGKKAAQWKPTALATHPNCRDSQLIELKPGWKVLPGGKQTFIGLDAWGEYIREKVTA